MDPDHTGHPDQYLVDGIFHSDRLVIDEIYRRYFPTIQKHITRNSGRLADAKDIFQEALLTIYRKKPGVGVTLNEPFGSYLHRLCKWLWLNELKKRKKANTLNHEYVTSNPVRHEDPDNPAIRKQREEDALFKKAFDALGDLCRQILRLSWTGLNLKQIGGQLGKSHGYLRRKRPECVREFIELVKEEQS